MLNFWISPSLFSADWPELQDELNSTHTPSNGLKTGGSEIISEVSAIPG